MSGQTKDGQYMTEGEAIDLIMREAQQLVPNVPPVITVGICLLRDRLVDIRDHLHREGSTALAGEVQDCINLSAEISEQIDGFFSALVESKDQSQQ